VKFAKTADGSDNFRHMSVAAGTANLLSAVTPLWPAFEPK